MVVFLVAMVLVSMVDGVNQTIELSSTVHLVL